MIRLWREAILRRRLDGARWSAAVLRGRPMRILDPAAADTGGVPPDDAQARTRAEAAGLQARIDQLAAHVQQPEQERASLRWMAGHDELTGLANRPGPPTPRPSPPSPRRCCATTTARRPS